MRNYIKLMRVHHYIKNLLVFVALACSGQIFDSNKLLGCVAGFFAFSLISSVIYIINDIRDREKDRLHPTKCNRPIAAGTVSLKGAYSLAAILLVAAIALNHTVFKLESTLLLCLYLLLNIAYSFGLKNVTLIDVTILVAGFLIRIMYGAVITDITISNWLYLTVIAIAFYFAFGKRRNELKHIGDGETRKVLKSYSIAFLDKNMYMCLTLANVFYALWTMDEKTVSFYNSNYMIFTVPIVLLITMRYSMVVEGDSDGDPVEVLLHDKILLILCVLYIALMFLILYL